MRKRIIITGGSGLLAVNWAYKICSDHDVLLFTHEHSVNIPDTSCNNVDLTNINHIKNAISEFNADIIVHAAGMTNVDLCEQEPEKAYFTNVNISENVAIASKELGKTLVHISSDHLFDGSKPLVSEDEPTNPVNIYGETKAQAEKNILEIDTSALVVRTNFYGWGHQYRTSLSDWIIKLLEDNKKVPAFYDSYFTPVLLDQLVNATNDLIELGASGIFNISGDKRLSKFNFANAIAEIFDLDKKLIEKISINEASLTARRPADMSLSNRKTCTLLNRSIGELESGINILLNNRSKREKLLNAVQTP